MPFRRPTKEEIGQTFGGNAFINVLQKILVVDKDDRCKWAICTASTDVTEPKLCEVWSNDFIADNGNLKLTKQDILNQVVGSGLTLLDGSPINNISELDLTIEHKGSLGFGGFKSTTSHIDLTYNNGQSSLSNGENKSFGGKDLIIADDLCIEIYDGSILSLSAVFI